jgi:hypothetical protein
MREQTQVQHTPGPIKFRKQFGWIEDSSGAIVCQFWGKSEENFDKYESNARRVVQCWNTHDELVEALRSTQETLTLVRSFMPRDGAKLEDIWNRAVRDEERARAALQKAGSTP